MNVIIERALVIPCELIDIHLEDGEPGIAQMSTELCQELGLDALILVDRGESCMLALQRWSELAESFVLDVSSRMMIRQARSACNSPDQLGLLVVVYRGENRLCTCI